MRINENEKRFSLNEATAYVIRTGLVSDHPKSSQE